MFAELNFGNVVEMRRVGTFVRGVGTCAVAICHLSFFYYGKLIISFVLFFCRLFETQLATVGICE